MGLIYFYLEFNIFLIYDDKIPFKKIIWKFWNIFIYTFLHFFIFYKQPDVRELTRKYKNWYFVFIYLLNLKC